MNNNDFTELKVKLCNMMHCTKSVIMVYFKVGEKKKFPPSLAKKHSHPFGEGA